MGAGSVSGAAVVWIVSGGCCVFSVEVHGHRPRRSVTLVVDTEAGAQAAAGVWRARTLLWQPARRSGGGVCVCTLPDSPPVPPPEATFTCVAAVRAGRVGVEVGPGAAAGLWRTRTLL